MHLAYLTLRKGRITADNSRNLQNKSGDYSDAFAPSEIRNRKMRLFVYCLLFLVSFTGFSQNIPQNRLAKAFQKQYNSANYKAIFEMFDEVLQALLTEEKTAELFAEVAHNFGKLKSMNYTGIRHSAYCFETEFDKGKVDLYFATNSQQKITALFVPRNLAEHKSILTRNSTKMMFPFAEEAFVYWGGSSVALNYHMADLNQQYAYDILMVANGAPYSGDSTKNESYLVFGKEILAPCDATVVEVIDGIPDNLPGVVNKKAPTGNTIVLETPRKEYLLFAHIKAGSILVKEGDIVKQGQAIGRCGNSGNTTQAHLHLQLQHTKDLYNSIGAKLFFNDLIVNGQPKKEYMPKKEDFVRNSRDIKD